MTIMQLRGQLGVLGHAGLGLLAAALLFFVLVLQPLQEKERALHAAGAREAGRAAAGGDPAGKLAALYGYLERGEETTDWLAKLHAIGAASGVRLRSATYRTQAAGPRLERYEIVLPVNGSYAQIRHFLKRTLADIPVLSLDQVSLRRDNRSERVLQAELRLTLHQVKR